MSKESRSFGRHYLVEFIGCDAEILKYVGPVKKVFLSAARQSKAGVVKYFFHQYRPFGVTGVILIRWSHFSIHTWPEDRYAAFDVFTCGKMLPEVAVAVIKEGLSARMVKQRVFTRGY